jgi:HK97 family phage major capsid protein
VLEKNVAGASLGWTFNNAAEIYLKRMKSTTGQFIWKEEMERGTLGGYPYKCTNMISVDADGYTSIFFGLWSDFIVGDQRGLTTETSYDATIQDGGQSIGLFQSRQTATIKAQKKSQIKCRLMKMAENGINPAILRLAPNAMSTVEIIKEFRNIP